MLVACNDSHIIIHKEPKVYIYYNNSRVIMIHLIICISPYVMLYRETRTLLGINSNSRYVNCLKRKCMYLWIHLNRREIKESSTV